MDLANLLFLAVVLAVVIYDFTNGFHDAVDMIATAIASCAMLGVAQRAVRPYTLHAHANKALPRSEAIA